MSQFTFDSFDANCSELYVRLEEASPLIEDIVVRADEALN